MQFWFKYFYVGQPKIIADHPGYHLGGPLGDPEFFGSTAATTNLAFPIRLLASAFIFLLSHLKLITLPMHSPTNTRHNNTSKDKFGTGMPHLADMPTAVHRQNSWKITGWSHDTVSMAMHCLVYNKLTPDGSLAKHVFDAAAAAPVFDTGCEAFFFFGFTTPHHCAPLETIPVETLPMTNATHKLLDSGQQHMWPHPQAITRRSNDV